MKKVCIFSIIILLFTTQFLSGYQTKHDSQNNLYLVDFKFNKRELKDILNEYAQLRGINILYSSTTQLNAKVTFDAGKKITFMKAWEFILMMLEQAGFSLVSQGKDMYELVSSDNVNTSSLPIFINTDPEEIAWTQERIRYIYYFKNISLTTQQGDIANILKNFFDAKYLAQQLIFDTNFNTMILTAKAETIKSVMKFIDMFDQTGERQIAEVFNLEYASSTEVAKILTDLIAGQDTTKPKTPQKAATPPDSGFIFSPSTKVVSLFGGVSALGSTSAADYGNTLVILGKKTDVELVKKFIKEHLDLPLEKGKSFFHVVDLQWLSASTLSTILQDLVTAPGGSGQSTSSISLSNLAFDPQIKIVAENVSQGLPANTDMTQPLASGTQNSVQRGSNRLIIAATNKDWLRIEEVIKKLDVPQKQVIIEALILDLSLVFTHKLASQIRTNGLSTSLFSNSVQAQAAMLLPVITGTTTGLGTPNVQGDLSQLLNTIAPAGSTDQSAASTIFMIGDQQSSNGAWAFFQLLALHSSSKTISRAFVLAQNNMPAVVTNTITKRLAGKLTAGVTATVSYQTVSSPVTISFTPLISNNDIINLQTQVDATYWDNPSSPVSGTQSNRELITNFSLKDGQVAILGGVTRNQIEVSYNGVPFLSKIPILGPLLFSNKKHSEDKSKLFMIIRTTIAKPRHDATMGKVTQRIAKVTNYLLQEDDDDEDLFSSLKDPISRWMFNEDASSDFETKILPLKDIFSSNNSVVPII